MVCLVLASHPSQRQDLPRLVEGVHEGILVPLSTLLHYLCDGTHKVCLVKVVRQETNSNVIVCGTHYGEITVLEKNV